jgi:hypothetical protein
MNNKLLIQQKFGQITSLLNINTYQKDNGSIEHGGNTVLGNVHSHTEYTLLYPRKLQH